MKDLPKQEILALIDAAPATPPERRVRYRGLTLCVVMASWNEEDKVGPGVAAVPRDLVDTVCIVDNGSVDGTAAEARAAGAVVISHPRNLGAGGGYRSGYVYGRRKGFDLIVELAGDNQDDPADIRRVVDTLIDGGYDYVHGSRWMEGGTRVNMTVSRSYLTRLYSFLFRILFGFPATDATNGFRVFKSGLVDHPRIDLWQEWLIQYELEPYFFIQTVRLGYKVGEAPVRKIYHREMRKNTKMVPIKSWWSILRPLFLLRLGIKR
ncbi:MAG TPA: glycosyltransferase family 2 protein [Thermoanaerobaculia bacterium]|nr:glycosyltransferase family 2 protein [Thermoanaerobaculia bacterium]